MPIANLKGPQGPAGGSLIDLSTATVDIVNTSVESTLYSVVIPANTLGTNGIIEIVLVGSYLNNSGATQAATTTIKYGGVTSYLATTGSFVAGASRRGMLFKLWLIARNATNSQIIGAEFCAGTGAAGSTTGVGSISGSDVNTGLEGAVIAVDSTLDKTFEILWKHPVANASLSIRRVLAFTRKL